MATPEKREHRERSNLCSESRVNSTNNLFFKLLRDLAPFAKKDQALTKLLYRYVYEGSIQKKSKVQLKKRIINRLYKLSKGKPIHFEFLFTSLEGMRYLSAETGAKNLMELDSIISSYKDQFLDDLLGKTAEDEIIIGEVPKKETII